MSIRKLGSPGTVIATAALIAALAGSAYAGAKIDTGDIAKGAITKAKIARGAVTQKALAAGAVQTRNLGTDAVTGEKVLESSLSEVPSAGTAANASAVSGLKVQKFFAKQLPGTALTTIATLGTIDLRAGCNSGGRVLLEIRPATGTPAQVARTSANFDSSTSGAGQGTLPPGGITILSGAGGESTSKDGTIEAATADGAVTTINWAARDGINFVPSANPEPERCFIFGTAIAG